MDITLIIWHNVKKFIAKNYEFEVIIPLNLLNNMVYWYMFMANYLPSGNSHSRCSNTFKAFDCFNMSMISWK